MCEGIGRDRTCSARGEPDPPGCPVLLPLRSRSRAGNAPTPFGQNQKPRPHHDPASATGVGASLLAIGPGSRSTTAVANPVDAVCLTQPRSLILLPLRARSRASYAPTACRQNRNPRAHHDPASAEGVGASLLAIGPGSRSTTAVANPVDAVCLTQPRSLISLSLRAKR
jgi:hypothetical protein